MKTCCVRAARLLTAAVAATLPLAACNCWWCIYRPSRGHEKKGWDFLPGCRTCSCVPPPVCSVIMMLILVLIQQQFFFYWGGVL